MKRTTALLMITLVLTGCRYLDRQRHAAANAIAAAVVRSLFSIDRSAPDVRRAPRPVALQPSALASASTPVPVSVPAPAAAAKPQLCKISRLPLQQARFVSLDLTPALPKRCIRVVLNGEATRVKLEHALLQARTTGFDRVIVINDAL